ncbi:MAG: hypothetical protein ACOY3P_14365 [Planctomycetota bacterium]
MAVPLYNDANYTVLLPADGSDRMMFDGHLRILGARPPRLGPGEIACAKAPDFRIVPREEWPDLIAQKDREQSWIEDLIRGVIPCNDQNGLNYCHGYGMAMAMQVARCIQGHGYTELSAESIAGPVTNWRNDGADPSDDLQQAVKFGACPASYMDAPYSRTPRRWKDGWEESALDYRVEEWVDLRGRNSFDLAVSACFANIASACGFIWWAHFVSGYYRVVNLGKDRRGNYRFAGRIRNNWGAQWGNDGFADFEEGKGTPDWAFGVRAMIAQD